MAGCPSAPCSVQATLAVCASSGARGMSEDTGRARGEAATLARHDPSARAHADTVSAEHPALAQTLAGADPALARTLVGGAVLPISADDPALALTLASPSNPHPSHSASPPIPRESERYRIGEELGRGGMGRVVLAVDSQLGRDVAMKELHAGPEGIDVGALLRFIREARVTGQLEHPNIVPVHELSRHPDGTVFYTMKRIRGRSLAATLREAPDLRMRLAWLRHFRDVCEAVAYAHSRGVVHRDLKPDNVMVGEFGETLVVDWGIAKVRASSDPRATELRSQLATLELDAAQTVAGYAIGTPAYMSPEQARGDVDAIDERSDVWGLGTILFEILTGRPPYVGTSALAVLAAVLTDEPPPVRSIAPDAPPELSAIADRALRRDPSARYPSAKAIADEIGAWQDGGRVRAYEYTTLDLVRLFVRRNRAATFAAVAIAAALAITTTLVALSYQAELGARRSAEARALLAEAERLDQLGHRSHAYALLRAAETLGDPTVASELVGAGLGAHAEEPQPLVLAGHENPVALARFSPDGARVATAGTDGVVREWEASTGVALRTLADADDSSPVYAVDYARDGTVLASAGASGAVTVWDLRTSEVRRRIPHEEVVDAIAFSPDGSLIATGARDGRVRVFDIEGRSRRIVLESGRWVQSLAFAPDGRRLAVAARDGDVSLVEVDDATVQSLDGIAARAVAWMPDGTRVVGLGREGRLVVWDAETHQVVTSMLAHRSPGTWVAVTRDGARVASASEDGQARLWTLETGALVLDLAHHRRVGSIELDPSGAHVVTTEFEGHNAAIWEIPTHGALTLRGHTAWVHDAKYSPDGALIASASRDGTIRLWDARDGAPRRVFTGHHGSAYAVAFSPSGRRLVSVGRDGQAIVWDPASGELERRIQAHEDAIYDVAFLDEDRVVTAAHQRVRVWNIADGRMEAEHRGGLEEIFFSVAVTARGDVAAGAMNGSVLLWHSARLGSPALLAAHEAEVNTVAFSPDGETLATGGRDGRLLLWDADSGHLLRELTRVERSFIDLSFSADGARIVGAVENETVRAWTVEDGVLVGTYQGHSAEVRSAELSPDGQSLLTASADATLRVVRVHGESRGTGNLRVCRGADFAIVPVALGPGIDPVWADASACAQP